LFAYSLLCQNLNFVKINQTKSPKRGVQTTIQSIIQPLLLWLRSVLSLVDWAKEFSPLLFKLKLLEELMESFELKVMSSGGS
jgi:hypothetical protein